MDQQHQKRRAIPLRIQHSSSLEPTEQVQSRALFRTPNTRAGSKSNAYDSPTSVPDAAYNSSDEQDVQIKRLQSRQNRFRALSIIPRNITPDAGTTASIITQEMPIMDNTRFSPFDAVLQPPLVGHISDDLGILQEVSNSSLRRKRSNANETPSFLQFCDDQRPYEESIEPQAYKALEARLAPIAAAYPTITANSSLPLRVDPARTPRARKGLSRGGSPRKPSHEDTPRYIEQLESQLAALQTQLQSLTSPSTTKGHSAKLRAVTAESRQLRQEVEDWERKFHDRISEQFGQHEMIVASLKAQIRTLQKELEVSRERVRDMVTQCADKDRQIIAAEGANYDLERRLEFMSELLALSPTKLSFDTETPVEQKRISAPRPSSSSQFRLPITVGPRHISPQRPGSAQRSASGMSPDSPNKRHPRARYSQEMNPFDSMVPVTSGAESATDTESIASTSAPGSARIPFSGRRSMNGSLASDDETRSRPTRRMRRFYTGSMGPRSLILPGATNYESQPWSTPIAAQTPQLTPSFAHTPSQLHGLGFKLPISPERRPAHLRAATWDENEGSARKERRTTTGFTPLPLMAPAEFLAQSPVSTTPAVDTTDLLGLHNRAISVSMLPTRNLYKELSRMQREGRNSGRAENDSVSASVSATSMVRQSQDSLLHIPTTQDDENATNFGPASAISKWHDLAASPEVEEPPAQRAARPRSWIPAADITPIFDDDTTPTLHQDPVLPTPEEATKLMLVDPPLCVESALEEHSISKRPRPRSWIPAPYEPSPSPIAEAQSTVSPTPNMTSRILACLTHILAPSTPAICSVLQNAWALVTLSRPVLEFRWWLVRLLVGGLQKKRRLKMLANGMTSSAKKPYKPAKSVARDESTASVQSTATFAVMRGLGISTTQKLLTYGINPDRSFLRQRTVSDSSLASTVSTLHAADVGKIDEEVIVADEELEEDGSIPPLDRSDQPKGVNKNGNERKQKEPRTKKKNDPPGISRPVAWLKLSMTLVFAVGVAIRDGPASLFKPIHDMEDYSTGVQTQGNVGQTEGVGD